MSKRTPESITEIECECRYLELAADDEQLPVEFVQLTGQYIFSCPNSKYSNGMIIYHCPFCGGAAPKSKAEKLFETISDREEQRLAETLGKLQTIDDALNRLGKPDLDDFQINKFPETNANPPTVQRHRLLQYCNLSNTANVFITERTDGKINWSLSGKSKQMQNSG